MKSKILACLAMGMMAVPAQAAIVVTMSEVGGNVEVTGSGSANLSGLVFENAAGSLGGYVRPSDALIGVGLPSSITVDTYRGASGPTTLGTLALTSASSGTGMKFGILGGSGLLFLPNDYLSGSSLSATSAYLGNTFAGLGLTTGTYVWNWGSGATADTFTLNIGTTTTAPPVPLPAAAWLLLSGLAGLGVVGRRKRPGTAA